MTSSLTRLLVAGAALALLPLALTACSAPTIVADPTPTPTQESPVEEPVKSPEPVEPVSGFTLLVDDLNVLSIEVPVAWTDVQTTPADPFAVISASTDIAAYDASASSGSFDVAGVTLISTQSETATADEYIEQFVTQFGAFCEDGETDVYDDGLYVGKYLFMPGCGEVGSDFVAIVASDYDSTQTILFTAVLVSEEDKTTNLDHLLESFYSVY